MLLQIVAETGFVSLFAVCFVFVIIIVSLLLTLVVIALKWNGFSVIPHDIFDMLLQGSLTSFASLWTYSWYAYSPLHSKKT